MIQDGPLISNETIKRDELGCRRAGGWGAIMATHNKDIKSSVYDLPRDRDTT